MDTAGGGTKQGVGDIDPLDDRALIQALRDGDSRAARWFVERFQGVVYGLCLRMMGHRHDAEDVVQDTFLRALRAASGFQNDRPIRPWLLGIAANRCRTALSRRSRRPIVAEPTVEAADHRPGLADPDDLAGELVRALDQLRPEYRSVFCLYHEQGLPYEEIGEVLDRPIGTIKTWLHRARSEMAEYLSRRGVDS